MRICLLMALFFASYFSKAQNWTIKEKEQLKINREIPGTWDKELIQKDIISNKYYDSLKVEKHPFLLGVFPVPNYNLIGKIPLRELEMRHTSFMKKKIKNSSMPFSLLQKTILIKYF